MVRPKNLIRQEMEALKSSPDLLPENDPPPQWPPRATFWIAVAVAAAGATIFGMVWGGLNVWESLAGVVLGGSLAFWGLRWMGRRATRVHGQPADNASLRQQIRDWRSGETKR